MIGLKTMIQIREWYTFNRSNKIEVINAFRTPAVKLRTRAILPFFK